MNILSAMEIIHKCDVNEKKTKVIIFGKLPDDVKEDSIHKELWKIGDKKIEEVDEYKYVGVFLIVSFCS